MEKKKESRFLEDEEKDLYEDPFQIGFLFCF